jgi:hypothetical protein
VTLRLGHVVTGLLSYRHPLIKGRQMPEEDIMSSNQTYPKSVAREARAHAVTLPAVASRLSRQSAPALGFLLALPVLILSARANAVDGVFEINQICAVNTGCFAGDTPGFPVTISEPGGSYRLTGALEISGSDTTAISLGSGADDVTVDLNGFAMTGPISCTWTLGGTHGPPHTVSCSGSGTGRGVDGEGREGVVLTNGVIRGFGDDGANLGLHARVHGVRFIDNAGYGLLTFDLTFSGVDGHTIVTECSGIKNGEGGLIVGMASTVSDSIASMNGGLGIAGGDGSVIRGSVALVNVDTGVSSGLGSTVVAVASNVNSGTGIYNSSGVVAQAALRGNHADGIENDGVNAHNYISFNGDDGIVMGDGLAHANAIINNKKYAIRLASDGAYSNNMIAENDVGDTIGSSSGNTGQNLCDGTTCP